jgi:hypothetical protein
MLLTIYCQTLVCNDNALSLPRRDKAEPTPGNNIPIFPFSPSDLLHAPETPQDSDRSW